MMTMTEKEVVLLIPSVAGLFKPAVELKGNKKTIRGFVDV